MDAINLLAAFSFHSQIFAYSIVHRATSSHIELTLIFHFDTECDSGSKQQTM